MKVTLRGFKKFYAAMERNPAKLDKAIADQIKESSGLIFKSWKGNVKKHNKTGKTLNSLEYILQKKKAVIKVNEKKSDNKPTALWLDTGTRPHVIRAKNKPFLCFYSPKLGHFVKKKSVRHPGTKANFYLVGSYLKYVGLKGVRFKNILTRRIKKYLEGVK